MSSIDKKKNNHYKLSTKRKTIKRDKSFMIFVAACLIIRRRRTKQASLPRLIFKIEQANMLRLT